MSIATEITRLQTAKADIKSAIEEKGVTVGDGNIDTYAEKIGEITVGGDITQNLMYYMNNCNMTWNGKAFPEGYELVLNLRDAPNGMNAMLTNTTGVKKATLICEAEGTATWAQMVRNSTVETLDITNFKPKPSDMAHFALGNTHIVSIIGKLDLSNCTNTTNIFNNAMALKDIELAENSINISISFASCSHLSDVSIQSIIDGLADLTGGTAQVLTLHSTVGDNLTDEQLSQIWAKNWTTN